MRGPRCLKNMKKNVLAHPKKRYDKKPKSFFYEALNVISGSLWSKMSHMCRKKRKAGLHGNGGQKKTT